MADREKPARWCVFLPCSEQEVWAIPQNCLAEIVTLQNADTTPPAQITWRGKQVPVLDLGGPEDPSWCDASGESGLVAVILGLKGQGNDYWAVALRGEGLAVKNIANENIIDLPDRVTERSTSAFELHEVLYQVPDLPELQKHVGMN
ncbi:MAG: hypothetical protein AB8B81_02285 [Halioglobus sp.]